MRFQKSKDSKNEKIFNKICENNNLRNTGKTLGKGGFGEVRELITSNKSCAGKLIEKKDNIENELSNTVFLKHINIIRTIKIIEEKYTDENGTEKTYELIVMEKATLKDVYSFCYFFKTKNLLKYINLKPPMSENLIRYMFRQIMKGMELLHRSELVHYDIKPANILIGGCLVPKISDFSLVRSIRDSHNLNSKSKLKTPGGTQGYLSPEGLNFGELTLEEALKQDYFAFGGVLYYYYHGSTMLTMPSCSQSIKYDVYVDKIHKRRQEISGMHISNRFKELILGLVEVRSERRFGFEETYNDVWVNKKWNCIMLLKMLNETDEEKLMMEMEKSVAYPRKRKKRKYMRFQRNLF